MKLSYDWLSDYVDLSGLTPQEVAERLTMHAFEVEEVRKVGPDIEGPLVIGEIVEINPHPNADKIRLTKTRIDPASEPLQIVCGASNILVGQRVPVALPGARVINRHDGTALPIKETKIRGVASHGMLCSPPELGLAAGDSEGILVLPGQPDIGQDARELLRLYPDWILYVVPRSNRGDALSVLGLAREVAALFGRPLRQPDWSLPKQDITSASVAVAIDNESECPFFTIRVLEALEVGPSPLHIVRRLEAVGVRPVNNVVDVTNYVLHELGQPLHAYDLGHVKGQRLTVRRAREGERLVTIDNRERRLSAEVLAIADAEGVVGVAGVMGGKASEVTDQTTFVALEAAAFSPARVRRSSRLLGLTSESSLRFERGVDAAAVRLASDRAAALLVECCGGYLGAFSQAGSDQVPPLKVSMRLSQLARITEIETTADEAAKMLEPLGFKTVSAQADTLEVSVPSFRRQDVVREIDLVEEVCRLWGYERIEPSMPRATAAPQPREKIEPLVREALSACGLNETWISSLTGPEPLAGAGSGLDEGKAVRVLNPLSEEHVMLRQSLMPGLIRVTRYNQDRGISDVWLYEIGRVYERFGAVSAREPGAREELHVAGILSGNPRRGKWLHAEEAPRAGVPSSEASRFYQAKGVVDNLLERLSLDLDQVRFETVPVPRRWFHPGRSCRVSFQSAEALAELGWLGQMHPGVAHRLGLREPACLFELNLDTIARFRKERRFQEIHATPAVCRDLTADLPLGVEQQKVYDVIKQAAGEFLIGLELVSVFHLSEELKSLSYRLTFQHPTETLTNDQLEEFLSAARQSLKENLSATYRF